MSLKLSRIEGVFLSDHSSLEPGDDCYFLGEYTPGRGYKYGRTNSLILNFKKSPHKKGQPEWRYKEESISKIAEAFRKSLSGAWLRKVTLVPIPPSKTQGDFLYDDRMTRTLEILNQGFANVLDVRELIKQSESTQADHESSLRQSTDDLIGNYYIDQERVYPEPEEIALFDDLLTTGKHFKAAQSILRKQYPGVKIRGIFVARRIFEKSEDI